MGLLFLNVFASVHSTETKNKTNTKNQSNYFPLFLAMAIENATLQANLSVWQKTEFEFIYLHGRSNHVQFDCRELDETLGPLVSKEEYPHEISFYPPKITTPPPFYFNYDQNKAQKTTPNPYVQKITTPSNNQTESPENSNWFSAPPTLQAENQLTPQYEQTKNQYQTENLPYTKNTPYDQQFFGDYQNSSLNGTNTDQVQNPYQTQTTPEYQSEATAENQKPSSFDSLQAANSIDFENSSQNAYDVLNATKLQPPQTTSSITSTQTIEGNDINAEKNTASQYKQESGNITSLQQNTNVESNNEQVDYSQGYQQQEPREVTDSQQNTNMESNNQQQVDYSQGYQQQEPQEVKSFQQNTNVESNNQQQVDYSQVHQQEEPREVTAFQRNTNVESNNVQQGDYSQVYQQQEPREITALRRQHNVLESTNTQQQNYYSQPYGQVASSDEETNYLSSQESNAHHEKDTENNLLKIEKDPNIVQSLLSKDLLQLRNEYELRQQQDKTVTKDIIGTRKLKDGNKSEKRLRREVKEETSNQIFNKTSEHNNAQNKGLKNLSGKQLQKVLKVKHQLKTLTEDIHIIDGRGNDEGTAYKTSRRKRKRGLRSLMNQHVKKQESPQSDSKTNLKPLVEAKTLSINDMWSINPSETNMIIQPSMGKNDKNSRNSPEHDILMKIETMRNGFERRHEECPTFLIFGTSSKWCYTLTADPNNCAEEFLEVKDMFERTCAKTQFFIYARQRKPGQTWTDNIKSSTMNRVRVLVPE